MDTPSALPRLDETRLATTRYLQALTQLDDESVRRPSVLPGWSRAHVIAHLCLGAEALARVLTHATAGEPAVMYTSAEDRDRDIEQTVRTHGLADLVAYAHRSAERLEKAWRTCDAAPDVRCRRTPESDESFPLRAVGPRRRAEVEIHHADLDVGYAPADWPADFSVSLLEQRQEEMAALPFGSPSMMLSSTDVDGVWKFGDGQGPEIHGTAGELAWWLVGRGRGQGLTSSATLPTLERWR